jgi:predicted DNA-binding antitoxin AbrB/MazE fold protein
MNMQEIHAIYENGAFYPLRPQDVTASNGDRVTLIVQSESLPEALRLATQVYAGLTPEEIDNIEQVMLDRTHFCDRGNSEI